MIAMGICWGSPGFPSPSFGRDNRNGNLTVSSESSAMTSVNSNISHGAVATGDAPGSLSRNKLIRVFRYSELEAATDHFSHPFGETRFDGNDIILQGWLHHGGTAERDIAIKLLQFPEKPSAVLHAMVLAKVESLCRLSHTNVVQLLGYCSEGMELLLVYESPQQWFSLEDFLYNSSAGPLNQRKAAFPALSWHRRLQIAFEVAQGLAYLHQMGETFPRHFQASYVFLDKLYAVKIAPFNFLATDSSENAGTTTSNSVLGAKNIVDIKFRYIAATALERKQNVYDFGVVLLEILTGLALGRNRWSPEYDSRIEWIKKRVFNRDKLVTVMDSNMGSYPRDGAFQVAELAAHCLERNSFSRPSMTYVWEALRKVMDNEISFPVPAES